MRWFCRLLKRVKEIFMSYGFKVIDANDNTILDSSINGMSGLRIRASGSSASASAVPTYDATQELLFINYQPTSGNSTTIIPDFITSPGTPLFRVPGSGSTISVNWAIVERFSDSGTTSPEGFGIKVFDADGDLQFNSDLFDGEGGVELTDVRQAYTLVGKPAVDGYAGALTNDRTKYVEVGWGVYSSALGGYRGITFANQVTNFHETGTTTGNGIYYVADYGNSIFENRLQPLFNDSAILLADIGGSV